MPFSSLKALNEICNSIVDELISHENSPKASQTIEKIYTSWRKPIDPQNQMVSPLILEGSFNYALADQANQFEPLAQGNILDPQLVRTLSTLQIDHPPYGHQAQAWRASKLGKSILVSSGTGSGKTECFLYPILSQILSESTETRKERGVRAILLYPTNALINSQKDRLHSILGELNKTRTIETAISFALYNGAMPQNNSDLRDLLERMGDNNTSIIDDPDFHKTERKTRHALRSSPPDILVTNYSMLDYMQLRSKDMDWILRSQEKLQHFVLDEAHSYQGTMALEIAMQIRRTLLNFNVPNEQVTFYATSATFSGESNSLNQFAQDLFSKKSNQVQIIHGQRQLRQLVSVAPPWVLPNPETVICDLEQNQGQLNLNILAQWSNTLDLNQTPWQILESNPQIKALRQKCLDASPLTELAQILFNSDEMICCQATACLIDALSNIHIDKDSLYLPARWHCTIRRPQNLRICLNPQCKFGHRPFDHWGSITMRDTERCGCGAILYPLWHCSNCGELHIKANEIESQDEKQQFSFHLVPDFRSADHEHNATWVLKPALTSNPNTTTQIETITIDPMSGQISDHSQNASILLEIVPYYEQNKFYSHHCHGNLAHPLQSKAWLKQSALQMDRTAFYIVQGLLPQLPEHHSQAQDKPQRGRRILTFQDSRQAAARFAPMLERFYRQDSLRWALWLSMASHWRKKNSDNDDYSPTIHSLDSLCQSLFSNMNRLDPGGNSIIGVQQKALGIWERRVLDPDECLKLKAEIYLDNCRRPPTSTTTLESTGLIRIDYIGLEQLKVPQDMIDAYGWDQQIWHTLLRMTLDFARQRGAVNLDSQIENHIRQAYGTEISARFGKTWRAPGNSNSNEDHSFPFFSKQMSKLLYRWLSDHQQIQCKQDSVDFSNRLDKIQQVLYKEICKLSDCIEIKEGNNLTIKADNLLMLPPGENLWRCTKSQRLFHYALDIISPDTGESTLIPLDKHEFPDELRTIPQSPILISQSYRNAVQTNQAKYIKSLMRILRGQEQIIAVEDTAQIKAFKNLDNENKFKKGMINLLSSTTTMEMGVDIGQLSSVICIGAPPSPANYLQRAGRAGRRGEGSTLILTIADNNPHDEYFADNPGYVFEKFGLAPEINFQRDLIIQRHLHFQILSDFFRKNYVDNHSQAFGNAATFFVPSHLDMDHQEETDLSPNQSEMDEGTPLDSGDLSTSSIARSLCAMLDQNGSLRQGILQNHKYQSLLRQSSMIDPQQLDLALGRMHDELLQITSEWEKTYHELLNNLKQFIIERDQNDPSSQEYHQIQNEVLRINKAIRRHLGQDYQDPTSLLILNFLARKSFLPIYGLPIHLVRTEIFTSNNNQWLPIQQFSLERDLSLALGEYAPDSQITVGGDTYRIMGIAKNIVPGPSRTFNIGISEYLNKCIHCGYAQVQDQQISYCPLCQQSLTPLQILRPKGFVTAKQFKSPPSDQDRTSPKALHILANSNQQIYDFDIDQFSKIIPKATIHYIQQGRDQMGYRICPDCGCAESISKGDNGSFRIYDSKNHSGRSWSNANQDHLLPNCPNKPFRCSSKQPPITLSLHHSEETEVIAINANHFFKPEYANLDLSQQEIIALTWAYALKYAGSQILRLDPSNLGVTTVQKNSLIHPVLFDRISGGAGLCSELKRQESQWQHAAYHHLYRDEEHHQCCIHACSKCLLSHETRFEVKKQKIQRKLAFEWINPQLISKISTRPTSAEFMHQESVLHLEDSNSKIAAIIQNTGNRHD